MSKIPLPHQAEAIFNAVNHFKENERGQLVMACGTGKTLTALWIAYQLKAKNILIALPSLQLQAQTVGTWLMESLPMGYSVLVIGSDKTIGKYYSVEATTSSKRIKHFLTADKQSAKIIFTTYQSAPALIRACSSALIEFDLAIIDEAHRTAGHNAKKFGRLLNDHSGFSIKKRHFMTATPRFIDHEKSVSMDNINIYGKVMYRLSTEKAIEMGILSDYKLLVTWISDKEISKFVTTKRKSKTDNITAPNQYFALSSAIMESVKKYDIRKLITFHKSIELAKSFQQILANENSDNNIYHINNKTKYNERITILKAFKEAEKSIMTNSRLLIEGYDLPETDAVAFIDAKKSHVEINQAIGRALRRHSNKKMGYVILPIFVNAQGVINDDDFKKICIALSAMGADDSRIFNYFQEGNFEKTKNNDIVQHIIPINFSLAPLQKIREAIGIRVWERLRLINKPSYEEVKSYAQKMCREYGINTSDKWKEAVKGLNPSVKFRRDVTPHPDFTYKEEFEGWRTFLGLPNFYEMRDVCRKVCKEKKITKFSEWLDYLKKNIEQYPGFVLHPQNLPEYKGLNDFMGIRLKEENMPYEEAKKFAQSVLKPAGINTRELYNDWYNGRIKKGPEIPFNIPRTPMYAYKDEWEGYQSFFGISKDNPKYRNFSEAKRFATMLASQYGIDNRKKWSLWHQEKIPHAPAVPPDIPADPRVAYLHRWRSWSFFMGKVDRNGNAIDLQVPNDDFRSICLRDLLPYEEAEKFAQSVLKPAGINTGKLYKDWYNGRIAGPKIPANLPGAPDLIYNEWEGYQAFLGTGVMPYEEAEKFAQSVLKPAGINTRELYNDWYNGRIKNGPEIPANLPPSPHLTYKGKWIGYPVFFGTHAG